jgi:phosphoribosylformimino-5-aminoimidazole carboxamide ribotide isomerase
LLAWPAVDLKGGRVVQLVGGRPEEERVSLPDPVAAARHWVEEVGFRALHVIDLDAALGTGSNRDAIRAILGTVDVPVQVGGGVRDDAAVDALLDAGADRVIAGTRAGEDRRWLEQIAARHPGRIVVAADAREREVVVHGWTEGAGLSVCHFMRSLDDLPLAGILVTDVGREGRLAGIDTQLFGDVVLCSAHPILAAGGIAVEEDLRRLADAGVAGAVLGMSIYAGDIDAARVAREFST